MASNANSTNSFKARKSWQAKVLADLKLEITKARKDPGSQKSQREFFIADLMVARLQQHLSQAELAHKAGMQQSSIARIETGHANPSLDTLLKIAKALDVSLVLE